MEPIPLTDGLVMTKPALKLYLYPVVALVLLLTGTAQPGYGFLYNQRWSSTATDGSFLSLGMPTTLTWSFVDDGTAISGLGGSDLIDMLDTVIGAGPGGSDLTQRPWFQYFDESFDRYSQVSGLSYAYEANDDGTTLGGLSGQLGVRGDVRIGGAFFDGPSNVLAFNMFPNDGDMVLDTGDASFYGNPAVDYINLKNVVMHEHGHGTGFRHSDSNNARLLMEPFFQDNFYGPQMDDIRGLHRLYGDFYEKNGGNDTASTATSLGVVANAATVAIGSDSAGTNRVREDEVDFISIDDNGDSDFFSFTVNSASTVDLTATPLGTTINLGCQDCNQFPFNSATVSDLTLSLFDTDQSTLLASDNSGGLGESDMISFDVPSAGQYYARVTGTANNIQMYELSITATGETALPGDFDNNGLYQCSDVDELVAQIAGNSTDLTYDLNADQTVDQDDLAEWLAIAGAENLISQNPYLAADADLDGDVDGDDYDAWNTSRFTATAAFCSGDFTADGFIDGQDLLVWNALKFQSADSLSAVPEPAAMPLLLLALLASCPWRRRG